MNGDDADRAFALQRSQSFNHAAGRQAETLARDVSTATRSPSCGIGGRAGGYRKLLAEHLLVDRLQPAAAVNVAIITDRDPEGLEVIRHSAAHLLAHAVKQLFPSAQVTIGPVIEEGFYYDFSYPEGFSPEDLERIEKRMQELAAQNFEVTREVIQREDAIRFFRGIGEEYKAKIIEDLPASETLTIL